MAAAAEAPAEATAGGQTAVQEAQQAISLRLAAERGVAFLQIQPGWKATDCCAALAACSRLSKKIRSAVILLRRGVDDDDAIHAVLHDFDPVAVVPTKLLEPAATDGDPAGEVPDADSLEKIVAAVESLPLHLVAFVERRTTLAETVLLAACNRVSLVSGAALAVAQRTQPSNNEGQPPADPALPLELLRLLGPASAGQLARHLERTLPCRQADEMTVSADDAARLGIVDEVCEDVLQLRQRQESWLKEASKKGCGSRSLRQADLLRLCSTTRDAVQASDGRCILGRRQRAWEPAGAMLDVNDMVERCASYSSSSDDSKVPRAKRLRQSVVEPCSAVLKAVMHRHGGLPEASLELLTQLAVQCLTTPTDNRSSFQEEGIEAIRKALSQCQQQETKRAEEKSHRLQDSLVGRTACEAELVAAQESCVVAKNAVDIAKRRVARETAGVDVAKKAVANALAAEKDGKVGLDKLLADKARLEAAERDTLAPLKIGLVSGAKAKKQAAILVNLGIEFKFDKSVLTNLPNALATKVEKRTEFDDMFVTGFEAEIQHYFAELDKLVAEGQPARDALAADVQKAQAELHSSESLAAGGQAEVLEAQARASAAEAKVVEARKALEASELLVRVREAEVAQASAALRSFESGPLVAFEELRIRTAAQAAEEDTACAGTEEGDAAADPGGQV
eukprot:TRINITY_DN24991_c0_g2_i2.p1 TRINITY_DN24991_c0_g2~~TRINITY_DN24991_c0_g2_i2.p1  ORF type:complete len:715 (-),score=193.13 TRINITY_DN24991_c0_g2_i2:258-2300(-)